jgi:hypothetical protein
LTVLATILAGVSSSEMIQAQYHRAQAAQDQSKAGDQWAFFQSKRIRNAIQERSIDILAAPPMPVTATQIQTSLLRLASALERGQQQAHGLASALAQADNQSTATPLRSAADALQKSTQKVALQAKELNERARATLGRADVQEALAYLGTNRLPPAPAAADPVPAIRAVLQAIQAHPSDAQLAPQLASIQEPIIEQAIQDSEQSAQNADQVGKEAEQRLREVDQLIRQASQVAQQFRKPAADVDDAGSAVHNTNLAEPALSHVRAIAQAAQAVGHALDSLRDYQAARTDFTARRTDRDAETNAAIAGLYELRVRKSNFNSERHRRRSKNFFYGMLAAQAGVATASFAIAARHRSGLWSLAGLAGLSALVFSLYVYLFV